MRPVDPFAGELASRRDARVRRALALRADAAERRARGAYLGEGTRLVEEALAAGAVDSAFVAPRLRREARGAALLSALALRRVPTVAVTDAALDALADARTPQGVVAVLRLPAPLSRPPLPDGDRPLAVAWHVQDPGNLGALVRVSEAAGAAGMVVAGGGADPWHPRAVRAAAGSIVRLPPFVCDPGRDLAATLRAAGWRLAAAAPRRGLAASSFDWHGPWAILLGGEGAGLPADLEAAADAHVHVPMAGRVESLSVAVAAALLLFSASRAAPRRPAPRRPPPPRRPARRRPPGRAAG